MDFKAREQSWLSNVDSIFKGEVASGGVVESGSILEQKNSYKFLLRKSLRIWWNKASLESYLAKNMIPRGLRVRIVPSFPVEDSLFRNRWEETCNICSRSLIELLIGINKKTLEGLENEIETVKKKLVEDLSASNMDQFKTEMEKQFLIWEKEVQEGKAKKFSRDLLDYKNNTVYRWHKATTTHRASSLSSLSSAEDTASNNTPRVYPMTRGRYKGRNNKNSGNKRIPTQR
ncbi:uncharacterized protein [Dendrobates tinctorius]|uniref:uncharacterized protein isoform X4 n=1 Tax=Dendrobates tinctorius TaxID=92724 RepID=UPI003CCA32A8